MSLPAYCELRYFEFRAVTSDKQKTEVFLLVRPCNRNASKACGRNAFWCEVMRWVVGSVSGITADLLCCPSYEMFLSWCQLNCLITRSVLPNSQSPNQEAQPDIDCSAAALEAVPEQSQSVACECLLFATFCFLASYCR